MTKTAKEISVSCVNGDVYVRAAEGGTFQNGRPLRRFALEANTPGSNRPGHSLPADTEFQKLPDTDITESSKPLNKSSTADLMPEAHDNLIQAGQRNAEKFKELTKCLRKNIWKRAAAEKKQS